MGGLLNISIRRATAADCAQLAKLRAALWPESSSEEHASEALRDLESGGSGGFPVINLVADESGRLVGFLQAGLRSHADGCETSKPVGYIEGWFVAEELRHRGIGRRLLDAAEDWARQQGCREMASDALIDNTSSQRAHEALGYREVDRCVHYRKALL